MRNYREIMKNITLLTQFGLSFITPTLLCIAISWWLNVKLGIGAWVYVPGFFFGLGGSATVAYKFFLSIQAKEEKEKKKKKQTISFNQHE
ncbi:MAG: AtpZ/AtpI family protein [Clostridiales bacterium]|nr:AtpZ/AtpI family protein [Candidatus Blautia equi]